MSELDETLDEKTNARIKLITPLGEFYGNKQIFDVHEIVELIEFSKTVVDSATYLKLNNEVLDEIYFFGGELLRNSVLVIETGLGDLE